MAQPDFTSLRILHVLRAPLGGLFRHVMDLTREQIARGHRVGMIADSLTGGEQAERVLKELEPSLALGLSRTPMRRSLHVSDAGALAHAMRKIRAAKPDIVHGHGSKGGAFARLAGMAVGKPCPKIAYTPHGGSFNYRPGTLPHSFYMTAERLLAPRTDVFLFESSYIQRRFHESATRRHYRERVVLNGISPAEFTPVSAGADAMDFLYVGELRSAKGIDTMLDALAEVRRLSGRPATACFVGSGPDEMRLMERAERLGLQDRIRFAGRMPAREAFRLGRFLIVPSRAESLPYIVLEAIGARVPMIATNVGGIPEIFGPMQDALIPCDDPQRLARAMIEALDAPVTAFARQTQNLAAFVASRFSIASMVDAVIDGYRAALSEAPPAREPAPDPAPVPP